MTSGLPGEKKTKNSCQKVKVTNSKCPKFIDYIGKLRFISKCKRLERRYIIKTTKQDQKFEKESDIKKRSGELSLETENDKWHNKDNTAKTQIDKKKSKRFLENLPTNKSKKLITWKNRKYVRKNTEKKTEENTDNTIKNTTIEEDNNSSNSDHL